MPSMHTCPSGHRWEAALEQTTPCPVCTSLGGALVPPAPSVPDPLPNLPGYDVLHLLGQGGMGVVYQARQRGLQRLVALKLIQFRLDLFGPRRDEIRLRFRTEAEAIARLSHPNVVQVFEVGEWQAVEGRPAVPYLSLEYVAGGSLSRRLADGPLAPGAASRLVETLARAVQAAHDKGVIHRDLKPDNVLLTEDGTPKVADFGLARFVDEPGATGGPTEAGVIVGTPSYLAPEQARPGTSVLGPGVDIWALGAILYTCMTGRPPFLAATAVDTLVQVVEAEPVPPSHLNRKVPRDLETICLKCLRKDPGQRYGSATELAEDLERFREGRPVRARPVGRVDRLWRWTRRNPLPASLLFLLIVTLTTGLAAVSVLYRQEHRQRERAEKREAQTRDILAGVVGRVSDDPRFRLAGIEPLRREMAIDLLRHVESYQGLLREGTTSETRLDRARSERWRGHLTWLAGTPREAARLLEQAAVAQERLLEENQDQELVEDTARTWQALAFVQQEDGQFRSSLESLARVCELLEPLVQKDDPPPTALAGLAGAWNNRGLEAARQGDLAGAREQFRRAARIWDRLLEKGNDPLWRAGRCSVDVNLGGLAVQGGDLTGALSLLEKARRTQEALLAEQPGMRPFAVGLAQTCHQVASIQARLSRPLEARKSLERARAVQTELITSSAEVQTLRRYQADHALLQGRLELLSHRLGAAQEAFERSVTILEELARATADPNLAGLRLRAHTYLGVVQAKRWQRTKALASFQAASGLLVQAAGSRESRGVARDLGETAYLLAAGLRNLEKPALGIVAADQSAVWLRIALERAPRSREVRKELSRTLYELGGSLRLVGDHARAARTCRERLALWAGEADELYDGACELCACARLAGKDPAQERAYLDEALGVLTRAVEAGLKGASQIRRDDHLAALRQRAEYRALVAKVEERDRK